MDDKPYKIPRVTLPLLLGAWVFLLVGNEPLVRVCLGVMILVLVRSVVGLVEDASNEASR